MFRYRLEPLLRYRKALEDEQRRSLAIANRQYLTEMMAVHKLEIDRAHAMKTLDEGLMAMKDANVMRIYDDYLRGSAAEIREEKEKADQTLQIVEMEREKLIERMKKRRIIEAHRERLNDRYKLE